MTKNTNPEVTFKNYNKEYTLGEGSYIIIDSNTRNDKCIITKITDEEVHLDIEVLSTGEIVKKIVDRKTFIIKTEALARHRVITFTPKVKEVTLYPY